MTAIIPINKVNWIPTSLPVKVPAEKVNELIDRLNSICITNGTLLSTVEVLSSVAPDITAIGTDNTDGYALTESFNVITGGAASTVVILPTAQVGLDVVVANLTTSIKRVYPFSGDAIDDKTATTGYVVLQPEQIVVFRSYTTALWQSNFEADAIYDTVYVDTIAENTTGAGVTIDGVKLIDGGALIITGGANTFDITNGTASLNVASAKAVDINDNLTVTAGYGITLTVEDAASSITLDEQTVEFEGEGTATRLMKFINGSNAAATLTLNGITSAINQDVQTTASPAFLGIGITKTAATVDSIIGSITVNSSNYNFISCGIAPSTALSGGEVVTGTNISLTSHASDADSSINIGHKVSLISTALSQVESYGFQVIHSGTESGAANTQTFIGFDCTPTMTMNGVATINYYGVNVDLTGMTLTAGSNDLYGIRVVTMAGVDAALYAADASLAHQVWITDNTCGIWVQSTAGLIAKLSSGTTALAISGTTVTGISIGSTSTAAIDITACTGRALRIGTKGTSYANSTALPITSIGGTLDTDPANNYLVGVFTKVVGDESAAATDDLGSAWFRTRMDKGSTTPAGYSVYGVKSQLRIYAEAGSATTVNNWAAAGLLGVLEVSGATTTFASGCIAAAVYGNVALTTTSVIASGAVVAAVAAISASAAITNTGSAYYGVYVAKSNTVAFDYGLKITDSSCTNGINIGTCTTGIVMGGTYTNAISTTGYIVNTKNAGTPTADVTAVEYGDGKIHTTVLTVTNKAITVGDNESLGVGVTVYALPAGAQIVDAAYISIGIDTTEAAGHVATPEVGLGTTVGTGAITALTTTMEDIIEGDAMAGAAGQAYVIAKTTTVPGGLIFNTGGGKDIYLNFAAAWADVTSAAAVINGTIVLKWTTLA